MEEELTFSGIEPTHSYGGGTREEGVLSGTSSVSD